MNKKVISIVLALCMMVSCIAVGSISTTAASSSDSSVSAFVESESTGSSLAGSIKDGQILQCWNWSFNAIKDNMATIASQGFTAVQTSPIQTVKESTKGDMHGKWWVCYQPADFHIDNSGNSGLGTSADFKAMCNTAHEYGVKVVVDAVLNHMANKTGNDLSDAIPSNIRNNSSYWHDISTNTSNWNSRYDITQHCMDGVPDLNTGNSDVQGFAIQFLKECIDGGADGFRFDGAKHIEVPNDAENCGSNFWSNVLGTTTAYAQSTRNFTPYYYGEVLNETGGGQSIVDKYTDLMAITANSVSNDIRTKVGNHNAEGASRGDFYYSDGSYIKNPANAVLWNESHDTYAGGDSLNTDEGTLKRTWALVGSRAQAVGMYFARPSNFYNAMGTAGMTGWTATEVAAVNHLRNAFAGQSEYLSVSDGVVYNERGTTGVVLVNVQGGGSKSVSVPAHKMAAGTYKDEITGSTFTVSGGTISGQIGNTGIAVVYNAETGPSVSATPGSTTYKTDSLTITLKYSDATSGTYTIDNGSATSFTSGKTITIGAGLPYDTTTTVKVTATDGSKTKEETYTYKKVDPSATQTIYYDNSSTNWSPVYCYMWKKNVTGNAAVVWPGTQMTSLGNNIYSYDVPDGDYDQVIFNAGDMTGDKTKQTSDLDYPGGGKIYRNGTWSDYGTTTPTQPTTQPTTAPVNRVLIGDVDLNGRVSIKDATTVQLYLAESITLTANAKTAADVNKDSKINISDVSAIQRYLSQFNDSNNYCGTYTGGTEPTNPTTAPTTSPAPTTQPTTAPSGNYIYYYNSDNWSTVYAHMWNSNNSSQTTQWHGTPMTDLGNKVWRVEVPSGYDSVVFNDNGSNQTDDIAMQGYGKIYKNGSWSTYSGGGEVTTPTSSTGKTINVGVIYYLSQTGYQVHWWNSAGQNGDVDVTSTGGTASKSVGSGYWGGQAQNFNMYTASIPSDAIGFKIHSGTTWFGDDASSQSSAYVFEYGGNNIAYYE